MEKTDLFLRRSRNNDEFARVIIGRNRSDETTKSVVAKWRSCEHLFAKVHESQSSKGFHSSDYEAASARYECVHCGLTDRLTDTEQLLRHYKTVLGRKKVADETAEWRCQRPEVSSENLLSEELINTAHPGVLFKIAIELCAAQNINPTKENIFGIMKELCEMETIAEQIKISTLVHASALIERYKKKHGLYRTT